MSPPSKTDPFSFRGKVVLVTGAGGGIGGASSAAFLRAGARVCGLERDAALLSAARRRLGRGFHPVPCDVSDPHQVEGAFGRVRARFRRIDVLFNTVGISGRRFGDGPVHACTEAGWDAVMDANVRSMFLCCRAALKRMKRGGVILNLASVLGQRGGGRVFDTHAYAASKGAILALTRAMASYYARDGIRVLSLSPGLIRTPMSARGQRDPRVLGYVRAKQRLTGDLGDPEDVARAALFLASDAAAFITGTDLPVDGGYTCF